LTSASGKRLGVIGTTFMRMAEAFAMDAVAWNRSARPGPLVPSEELLKTANVLSLRLALTAETRDFSMRRVWRGCGLGRSCSTPRAAK
jgi:phosphoglycerate dehydrogenase-like enzyme